VSSDSHGLEISDFELRSLSELGADSTQPSPSPPPEVGPWSLITPPEMDEAAQAKFRAEQEEKRAAARDDYLKRKEEADLRRKQAEDKFKAALDERIRRAYQQGKADTVSQEALRAVSVRSFVLLGVVAAVVAMPLVAMFFRLEPQAFGAYIAPVTGITGTIVGYWFGTVGQGATGKGPT
jgi:preprotein translocase subunit SecF